MNVPTPLDAMTNNLLASLRDEDFKRMLPHLKSRWFDAGDLLYKRGDNVETVYFPKGPSLVSFVVVASDRHEVETVLVGREGAVGGVVSQGYLPAYSNCEVRCGGPFYSIGSAQLEVVKHQSMNLRHLFARYADCLVAQMFQSVACNAVHTIQQRTAKWLLAAIDRTGDSEVPMTQEQLASMLGVGRSYISRVVRSLREEGLLRTRRGHIVVADIEKLRKISCNCNDLVRQHFDEVLHGVYPEETAKLASVV